MKTLVVERKKGESLKALRLRASAKLVRSKHDLAQVKIGRGKYYRLRKNTARKYLQNEQMDLIRTIGGLTKKLSAIQDVLTSEGTSSEGL